MEELAVIKLKGELHRGFWLTLEIEESEKLNYIELTGKLPPAIDLIEQYQKWQSIYRKLEYSLRLKPKLKNSLTERGEPLERFEKDYIDKKKKECQQAEANLKKKFNRWLDCNGFAPIASKLNQKLHQNSQLTILIKGESKIIELLPWHLWELLDDYRNAEIVFNSLKTQECPLKNTSDRISILLVVGNCRDNIYSEDRKKFLEELTQSEIVLLKEPSPEEFKKQLWKEQWHIIILAGHSKTVNQTGSIHINQQDSLTIKELKDDLKIAVEKGLQLAIINSCDGLGLALELQELNMPNAIFMREPLPDRILHQFTSYFLPLLARGMPIHLALRSSRDILREQNQEYPCVDWLPVIFQNTDCYIFTWSDLLGRSSIPPTTFPTIKEPLEPVTRLISPKQLLIDSNAFDRGSQNQRFANNVIKKNKQKIELTSIVIASSILLNLFVVGILLFFRLSESRSLISINSPQQQTSKSFNSETKLSLDNSRKEENSLAHYSGSNPQNKVFEHHDLLLQEIERSNLTPDDSSLAARLKKAEQKFPQDYRFTYKLIQFKIDPSETEHDLALELLKKAAVKAIKTDRTKELLEEMNRDRIKVRNIRKLYLDRREWDLIVEALQEKDLNLVRRLQF